MRKSTSVLLGALVLAAVGVIGFATGPFRCVSHQVDDGAASGIRDAVPEPRASASALAYADSGPLAGQARSASILDDPSFLGIRASRPGFALLDGGVVPPLAYDAPSRVRFGVVLVNYRGAQGAAPTARTKAQALARVQQLVELAKEDFKEAVSQGDEGSTYSVGWVSRGILEPAQEYVAFSTQQGQVAEPVDTPRGYWIVKVHATRK